MPLQLLNVRPDDFISRIRHITVLDSLTQQPKISSVLREVLCGMFKKEFVRSHSV
ncbi:MAG: hypothetical protein HOP33_02940 [Verrucomicrobia bacterium]|nr:hypothetical protein [Verrucomicrobiota bacterium]